MAAGGQGPLYEANIDPHDTASLQSGAKLFVNYCLSCHSAAFQRYNRVGRDLGLSDEELKANLMFASDDVHDPMTVSMKKTDAEVWFGTAVPDLSLVARSRGVDWLYTYLLTFYEDPSRPLGVDNLRYPKVGMPHVLWELQGIQRPLYIEVEDSEGVIRKEIEGFELVREGSMSEDDYKRAVRDLVNFLAYVGEPAKLERQRLGVWVLLFLGLLFVLIALMGVIILFNDPFPADRGREARTRSAQVERGEAVPRAAVSREVSQPTNQMSLRPGRGGHYFLTAEIGGADIDFLVDTGASLIALSYEDAERIGLDPDNLEYNGVVQTANGTTKVAPITLDTVRVGQLEVDRVQAIVSKAPMGTSLLGMSFLRRLESYRVEDGNLVLHW